MLHLLLAVSLSVLQLAESETGDSAELADFHSLKPGLVWTVVNDNVMGGRSSGGFEISDGRLRFHGSLITDGGGFASIRTEPEPLDMEPHQGVMLKVRGDGRSYRFRIVTAESDYAYMADFRTREGQWEIVDLPFSTFQASRRGRTLDRPPLNPSDITSIGFMIADRRDGEFALEVEWIRPSPGETGP
jgi:NADH dehydrogenase [ubiquinone] 1 alpha subcomplex assembly factor 1